MADRSVSPMPAATQESGKIHVGALDHLRGLAALFVCLFHFSTGTLPKLENAPMAKMWGWGFNGVTIFFVISGFVIPFAMLQSRYTLRDFGQFMGKRIVRIGPPSWVAMALTLGQWALASRLLHSVLAAGKVITPGTILLNMFYLVPLAGLGMDYWFNGVFWTLSVEFQYYVLLALAFPLLVRNRFWLLGLCAATVLLNFWLTPVLREALGMYAETRYIMANISLFWLGIVLCFAMCGRLGQKELWISFGLLTLAVYLQMDWLRAVIGAATFLFIRFATFRNVVTAHLGKVSYSLYLIHIVVGTTIEAALTRVFHPTALWHQLVLLWIVILLTIGAATLFYHWVEAPCIQLTKRLFSSRKISKPQPVSANVA